MKPNYSTSKWPEIITAKHEIQNPDYGRQHQNNLINKEKKKRGGFAPKYRRNLFSIKVAGVSGLQVPSIVNNPFGDEREACY